MADKHQPIALGIPSAPDEALRNSSGDEELMRALQSGDGNALKIIFDRYHRLVLVTALRIVHDIGEAEDVVQSVFFEIFQKAAQFDPVKGNLSKWLLQYAYHRSINRKNYLTLRHFYRNVEFADSNGEALWTTKVESACLVSQVLAQLNGQQRQVLELVFFREMTLKEIAEQTKQSFGKVRHHYYRGLKELRGLISRDASQNGKEVLAAYKEEMGGANA